MRKFIYLLFLASITVMAVGCSDDIIEQDRLLKPSESEITFTSAEQSKSITIETDVNNDFTAVWQGGDWGSVGQETGSLTIHVDANESMETRTTKVFVTLNKGGLIAELEITQSGSDALLSSLTDELFFNQLVGRKDISILTNQSDWQATFPAEEWASVIIDRIKGVITVDVLENTLEEDRTFKITLSSAASGLTKEIKVTQSAILTYILPYLNFGAPAHEMLAFEEARGSTYQSGRNPYVIRTLSSVMNRIYYRTDRESYYIESIESQFTKASFDKEIYTTLLEENEYKYEFVESTMWGNVDIFWKESDKTYSAIFMNDNNVMFSARESKPNNPIQDKPMRSFDSYPFGFHKMTATFDEVKAWEAANGGVLNKELSEETSLVFLTESDPITAARIYIIDGTLGLSGVTKITTVVRDISFAMYPCLYTNIITNEFQAILDASGWVVDENSALGGFYYEYSNVGKNLKLRCEEVVFEDLPGLEDKPVLCLVHTPLSVPTGFSSILSAPRVSDSKATPVRAKKAISLSDLAQ